MEVLKNDGGKAGQHWELKLAIRVPGEDIFIFNGCLCSCCIAEDLGFLFNPFYKDIPTPCISSWFPHSLFIEIKGTVCCSHSSWCCVGVFRQLCCHNIIIKLRHNFIDYGTCVNSLYFIQFSDIRQFINLVWFNH